MFFFGAGGASSAELLLSIKVRPSRLNTAIAGRPFSCRSASRKSQQQRAASERSYKAFVRELCWKLSESSTEKADVVVRRPKTARLAQGERQNEWNGNF